ncbi:hypothetical protein AB0I82_33175 [Streptomyces sp. NPDC050315]|uniref:hypothetical protein n=1 Tax=Streptomyces sp. NPDC050315 TaxID=3155039 RepID=UPI0034497FEF
MRTAGRPAGDSGPGARLTRLRSVSEALKSELYRHLAGAGPYHTDAPDAVLLDRAATLEEDASDLIRHTAGIAPAERALPQVHDTATYVELRLRRQITEYYRPRAQLMRRRLAAARRVEMTLGAAAAALAAAGGALGVAATGTWTAVVTTVTVAVVTTPRQPNMTTRSWSSAARPWSWSDWWSDGSGGRTRLTGAAARRTAVSYSAART